MLYLASKLSWKSEPVAIPGCRKGRFDMPGDTTNGHDPFNLERFVEAQRDTYETACQELAAGAKSSHWMWFVFPQLRGLGASETSRFYGIGSLAEATAYLGHPILGPRLRRAVALVLSVEGRSIGEIMGMPDDLKLRSSMTLFALAGEDDSIFLQVLDRYFGGKKDEATLGLLRLSTDDQT
jgi:uncharacterized protein (DUF1810 family)